jgi:hypothetical protein
VHATVNKNNHQPKPPVARRSVDETASERVTMAGLATTDAVRTRMGASARRGMDMSGFKIDAVLVPDCTPAELWPERISIANMAGHCSIAAKRASVTAVARVNRT